VEINMMRDETTQQLMDIKGRTMISIITIIWYSISFLSLRGISNVVLS